MDIRAVEHAAHGVIGGAFQTVGEPAVAIAGDGADIGGHQALCRVFYIKRRPHREVTRHHVWTPVVQIGAEPLWRSKVFPIPEIRVLGSAERKPDVWRK